MKQFLLIALVCLVGACGALKGKRGRAGADAQTIEAKDGEAGEKGSDGKDAVVTSLHCDYELTYPNDPKHPYVMHYAELTFAEGSVLATLTMTYTKTGQQLFREAALFAPDETIEINGVNWLATSKLLVHKPSKTKYIPKCK